MRLPDPQRSCAVLIGTSKYEDENLLDLPVIGKTVRDMAAAITDPVHGVVSEGQCTILVDEGDIRLIGRQLRSAARRAEDLLLVFYSGHGLVGGKRHDLYLALPESEWAEPEFTPWSMISSGMPFWIVRPLPRSSSWTAAFRAG